MPRHHYPCGMKRPIMNAPNNIVAPATITRSAFLGPAPRHEELGILPSPPRAALALPEMK
jgi:hypothetical protein